MTENHARETWCIDTTAPLQSVLDDPECPPLLRQTLTGVLSWQVRNETLIEGALRSPRLASQWAAALLALGATLTVVDDGKSVEIPLETLLRRQATGKPATLRVGVGGIRWGEAHVARTPADEPIVAAIAGVRMSDGIVRQARVALTGVWSEPVRLAQAAARLVGDPLNESSIQAVAEAVQKEVAPKGDFRGSEEYRRTMANVLTRRALEACLHQETANERQ